MLSKLFFIFCFLVFNSNLVQASVPVCESGSIGHEFTTNGLNNSIKIIDNSNILQTDKLIVTDCENVQLNYHQSDLFLKLKQNNDFITMKLSKAFSRLKNVKVLYSPPIEDLKGGYDFSGLAVYLNLVIPIHIIEANHLELLELPRNSEINPGWIGYSGRYKAFLVSTDKETEISLTEKELQIDFANDSPMELTIYWGEKNKITGESVLDLSILKYTHLWYPLRILCHGIEGLLRKIHQVFQVNWGWTVVIFAILVKILLSPFSFLTAKFQRNVNYFSSIIEPKLKEIKASYKGEEAHEKMMNVYKSLGITPFYTLKPFMFVLIQIPILIAVFNTLGEMSDIHNASFLWISNLAYPDAISKLPWFNPIIGKDLNLLPFMMVFVTGLSVFFMKDDYLSGVKLKKQKRNILIMGLVFFLLFYPFPAVMVLYWTCVNLLQIIQEQSTQYIKRKV